MKQNEILKTTFSSDHESKQRPATAPTSEMPLQLLSVHGLPEVPQFEVDTDHDDPFAASLLMKSIFGRPHSIWINRLLPSL